MFFHHKYIVYTSYSIYGGPEYENVIWESLKHDDIHLQNIHFFYLLLKN